MIYRRVVNYDVLFPLKPSKAISYFLEDIKAILSFQKPVIYSNKKC
jgi:hypothetical protein